MHKKLLLLSIVFVSFFANAQDTIRGIMNPAKKYSWIILYQLKGASQEYISNATVKDGKFELIIPKGKESGVYRLLYDNKKNMYADVLYNYENIEVEFHPDYPSVLIRFKTSKENILYQKYLDDISEYHNVLDSLQVVYFKTNEKLEEEKLKTKYLETLKNLSFRQNKYENASEGMYVNNFIKANNRYFAKTLIKNTQSYLDTLKTHYFDFVDFNNNELEKSAFFMDRIIDYIMYINAANDEKTQLLLYKKAIDKAISKIEKIRLKKDIIESILFMFAQKENKKIVDYIFKNHYTKLPVELQDTEFKIMIEDFFKTAIGQPAPDIKWDVYGKKISLYKLPKNTYNVIVFWSSTCSHCLKEIPEFNEYLINKKEITALAIGLESDESKANWKEYTFDLTNIKHHILGLNKWKNQYSQDYGVTGTPSYFVLDTNKKIIAKPYDLKELKEFFDNIKQNE